MPRVRRAIACGILMAHVVCPSRATPSPAPKDSPTHQAQNLDFEDGTAGSMPAGWSSSASSVGYRALWSRERPHRGRACLVIDRDTVKVVQLCFVAQTIDPSLY